ncbi:TPA: hypothetical protein N0F65_011540 [Lagenidium giganteum]|uniref:Magnesium transporter n=1 Tax=Lagenidium giganteum TaxID=4803 RepID=A0AAV2Z664_9STRA|nr:TPA: hypothetical protein N0F65_011540 [Lagenidium giganteum]
MEAVLCFDNNGDSAFQELSRMDIMRLTEEAAKSMPAVSDSQLPLNASAMICDVQRVHARDIRKLDNAFAVSNEPFVMVRKQAILINADPLRAIILCGSCLVFVPDGADSLLQLLKTNFHELIQRPVGSSVPYEFLALEALLLTVSRYFTIDLDKTSPVITAALDRLANGRVSSGELETLRVFKNTIDEFESQVDGLRRVLMELLDNEEDLRLLNLSKLREQPALLQDLRGVDSEEAEALIESFLQDIYSTRTKATLLQHRIQNTESLVMLKLDSMRNYLLGVDVLFSIVAICFAFGTYVTGCFGMNLNSHVQEDEGWFWSILGGTAHFMLFLGIGGVCFFKQPQNAAVTSTPTVRVEGLSMLTPRTSYRLMEDDTTKSSSRSINKYGCQFDPGAKRGQSLVLKFDIHGESTFLEMTRLDVLRMAQNAGRRCTQENDATGDGNTTPSPRRGRGKGFGDTARLVDVQRVHARDLRKLDNAFAVSNEPSIVLRRQAILMNADPLRAVIMRDTCLVFVPDGADSLLSLLREKFKEVLSHEVAHEAQFEFHALEALLATICRHFELDYEKKAPVVTHALDRLSQGRISAGELETLRVFKNTMDEFESQVDGIRRMLMEILDNEEDLRLLYLTKLHADPGLVQDLFSFDSEEAEALIETYLQDIYSTRTKATLLQHRIQNTESLVMLKLDSMRNYLLGVDLFLSLVAISLSIGTYATGVFGMNLDSGLQQRAGWFWGVVIATIATFFVLTITGVMYFRRMGIFQ